MTSFAPYTATKTKTPETTKHVNYTLGMILGMDDFTQEFAYLAGRDQWLARDLLGYGTVCGLKVNVEGSERGPRVVVEPGVALTPRGQLVRVSSAQCAHLNDWLAVKKDELLDRVSSPPDDAVGLYVVLCYRDCATDPVPIPGEPCRTEEQAMAPSRLKDDFTLELHLTPPDQLEEDALRNFVAWLRQIEISDSGGDFPTLEEFEEAVRQAFNPASPPSEGAISSPPDSLRIPVDMACDYLRIAFRIWTTELRPAALGPNQACGDPPEEECLLLAELHVPLVRELMGDWKVKSVGEIEINEDRRPFLIHLRLLQESLLCGALFSQTLSGDVTGSLGHTTVEKIRHIEVDASAPANNQVLTFAGGKWKPANLPPSSGMLHPSDSVFAETSYGLTPNRGISIEYSRGDHTHGTPPLPTIVGDFVEHPAGLPRYLIVAAGEVKGDGTTNPGLPYNGLQITGATDGSISMTFEGYVQPAEDGSGIRYIVKVLPVANVEVAPAITVNFDHFDKEGVGFVLRVTDPTGKELSPKQLVFMVEVSQYGSELRTEAIRKLIDLNTATQEELQSLRSVGPVLAARIIKARDAAGGFKSVDDLLQVTGIGPDLLAYIRPYITVRR